MRVGPFFCSLSATWPLVRLSLLAEGIRLESSVRFLRFVVPIWEARYDELAEVQAVGRIPLFTTGIRFRTETADEWIVYWTPERSTVMRALAAHGVKINTDPVRLHFLNPGK